MWVPLGHKHYILKKEKLDNECSIYVSDFVHLWIRRQKNEEIVAVFKELNPLIEASELKLLDKVLSLFDGNAATNKIITENDGQLKLHLESDLSGIKFQFKLELELQNAEMFFTEITLPFMLLAARLQIRENKLIEIILKKDAEINEYKRENDLIKRSHLITKEFNRSELMEGELEESNSSFDAIMSNPSTILNIVDAAMFDSTKSHKLKKNTVSDDDKSSEVNDPDITPAKIRRHKTDMKTRKTKNRIDLHISEGAKKKSGYKFNLNL